VFGKKVEQRVGTPVKISTNSNEALADRVLASAQNREAGLTVASRDVVPVTLIPRPGQLPLTLRRIEELIQHIHPQQIRTTAHAIHSVVTKVARENLNKLREVLPFVDFICVACLDELVLDKECNTLVFEECGGKVYSPTAETHRGTMSGSSKSDASYTWTIFRKIGGKPVTLLLQHIRETGKTSLHYHKKTTETFVSLFGEAFIYIHHRLEWAEGVMRKLVSNQPIRLAPEMTHQLITAKVPAVNVLCMENFSLDEDPALRDHIYEEASSDYRRKLAALGLE
jgi:hypothetical protein